MAGIWRVYAKESLIQHFIMCFLIVQMHALCL
jgi:hypothetical protein